MKESYPQDDSFSLKPELCKQFTSQSDGEVLDIVHELENVWNSEKPVFETNKIDHGFWTQGKEEEDQHESDELDEGEKN